MSELINAQLLSTVQPSWVHFVIVCNVDYILPWEDKSFEYPSNLARPLSVAIEASNGASDYGNKFGEPILVGFARSFGMVLPGCEERREWIKPIMFTGGIGSISNDHVLKDGPSPGENSHIGSYMYRYF